MVVIVCAFVCVCVCVFFFFSGVWCLRDRSCVGQKIRTQPQYLSTPIPLNPNTPKPLNPKRKPPHPKSPKAPREASHC